jgi:hypothetical protein
MIFSIFLKVGVLFCGTRAKDHLKIHKMAMIFRHFFTVLKTFVPEIPPPIAFWPLNSTYDYKDDKGVFTTTATEVTLTKGPCDVPDTAFEFTKVTKSHLRVTNNEKLNSPRSFSVIVMVKPYSGVAPILRFDVPNSKYASQLWLYPNNLVQLAIRPKTQSQFRVVYSGLTVPFNMWSFLGVSYNADTGAVVFVINEMTKAMQTTKNLISYTPADLYIGARKYNGNYFDGAMSSLRFFDVALTVEEMGSFRIKCPPRGRGNFQISYLPRSQINSVF